jgi:CheY-like chemotaxis protein/HPt (histidine-containing phosphotransfer) domain-containing protein
MDNLVNVFAYRARQKDLGINASLAPDVPSGLIGDPGRLRQILKNLIDNAIKFTVKGEIHIEGHVAEDLGDRIKIRFSVKDSGIGIPRERHSTIFDSFTQADSSTTRKYGGTGLGTTISKQLTELMGGEIGVKSQEGKGSTFWFTAVFSRQVVEKSTQARYNERQVFTQEQMGARRKSVHILLVEDYPTNQQVAMNHLKAAGYHVDLAENGLEALALYKERRYDLILMDIQMPVMDGYTATSKIRRLETQRLSGHGTQQQSSLMPHTSLARTWPGRMQDEETEGRDTSEVSPNSGHVAPGRASIKRVPIIAMTAHAITGYRERCLEVGMDDYLAKPLTRREFLAMIEKWTGANEPPPDSPKPDTRVNQPPTVDHHQSKEKTPIDFEKALKEFVGNKTVLMKVLNGFVENARGQIGILRQAITDGDADRVRREAHSIKGGAANLTAVELSRTAFEMENIGKSGSMERGIGVLKRLEKELNSLDVYISTLK